MENLSPFTRKLVALGLLFVLVVSTINLVVSPLFGAISAQVDALNDARFRRAKFAAQDAAPPLPRGDTPKPTLSFKAASAAQASELFSEALQDVANRTGISLEVSGLGAPAEVNGRALQTRLIATAAEEQMLAFINQLEQGDPAIRLTAWRLSRIEVQPAQMKLEAQVAAAWTLAR